MATRWTDRGGLSERIFPRTLAIYTGQARNYSVRCLIRGVFPEFAEVPETEGLRMIQRMVRPMGGQATPEIVGTKLARGGVGRLRGSAGRRKVSMGFRII